jgi:hypothetical protein
VEVADLERGNLGAAQADLKADRQDGAVAQAFERVSVGQVEQLSGVLLGESERGAFLAVDRRPRDFSHRVFRHVAVADQMLEQARQRRHSPADGRWRGLIGFPHVAFPGDDRAVIDAAELVDAGDAERRHEVPHVELVGAAGARALLRSEPDFFLGDVGKPLHEGRRRRTRLRRGEEMFSHGLPMD